MAITITTRKKNKLRKHDKRLTTSWGMVCGGESCAVPSAILLLLLVLLVVDSPRVDEPGRQQLDEEPVPALERELVSAVAATVAATVVKRAQAW